LLNHLISLLDPVADIADNLASLQDLPRALSDVAIFKGAIEGLMDKMQALPPAPPPQIEIESVNSLKSKVSELRQSMESQGSFQSGKEEIARVLKGMEGIERDVKDLRTGLRNPITPKSDPNMVKLLDVANTMKTILDRIATKLDTPSTPTRMECDMMGVERHLAYLKEKTAELKDSLNQIRTRFESAAEDQRPNTPSSDETVTRFPVRGLALRHSEESSQPPRTVPFAQKMSRFAAQMDPVSPPSPDDTHSKGPAASSTRRPDPQIQSRFAMIMDPVSPPSDVFGPKAYISGVFKVGSSEGSPNDPFALLGDDSLSNAPSQADPPSSYTMPSQAKRDHSAGSGSTSTSNSQRRSKRVKINSESQPSSIKTRSQVKKVSNTPEEPIIVDDDSPPKAKDASASKDTKQEIIEESLKSLEPTQTNTQTACQPSQHPLTQRHPVRRPEHLELLAMEKNLTPSSGYRRPVTYGSVDKGRNGKRRALTLEEIADEGVVAEL